MNGGSAEAVGKQHLSCGVATLVGTLHAAWLGTLTMTGIPVNSLVPVIGCSPKGGLAGCKKAKLVEMPAESTSPGVHLYGINGGRESRIRSRDQAIYSLGLIASCTGLLACVLKPPSWRNTPLRESCVFFSCHIRKGLLFTFPSAYHPVKTKIR